MEVKTCCATGRNEAIMEKEMLKKHGNPMRNKYMSREADFVMFADDDNWYTSDALKVRFWCSSGGV